MNERLSGWNWRQIVRSWAMVMTLSAVLGMGSTAHAAGPMGRNFGLGLSLGNPTSFTGKYYLNDKNAIDFHVGVFHAYGNAFWNDTLFLGGDYLFDVWDFVDNASVKVPFYAGPGLGLLFDTYNNVCVRGQRRIYCDDFNFAFGPRMPLGVGVQFNKAPFELFLEMTPTLMIVSYDNGTTSDLGLRLDIPNFALVGRFYFE